MKYLRLPVILLTCLLTMQTAWPDDDEDHEVARRAVERGEILPLSKILSVVGRDYPGRVLEVELDREKGRYVYEIEVLQKDGRIIELMYDGESGKLLESEVEDD